MSFRNIQLVDSTTGKPVAPVNTSNRGLLAGSSFDTPDVGYTLPSDLDSYSDRGIEWKGDSSDIMQEARAQRQSAIDKIANGVGKMGVLAGTTFADGVLGTAYGLVNWGAKGIGRYAEGDPTGEGFEFSDFWNNPVSQYLQTINEASEEYMPNYRTRAEEDSFWLAKAFGFAPGTANFWGDTFIKNLGFTVGALGSAAFTMGVGTEVTGAKAGIQAIRQNVLKNKTALSELQKAVGKATPFKNTGEIAEALIKTDIRNASPLLKELAKDASKLKFAENTQMLTGSFMAAQGEARIEAIHAAKEFEEKRVQELIAQGYNEEEANIKAHQESLEVGNWTFGANLPILTISDFYQFGKMFKGGFKPVKANAGQVKGNLQDVLMGKGAAEAAKLSTLQKAGKLSKYGIVESQEEMSQAVASEAAQNYVTRKNDGELQNTYIGNVIKSFGEVYGDIDRWEEGFIGGLTGLMGMPNFGKIFSKSQRKDKGTSWWTGGLAEGVKEIREFDSNSKKLADAINSMPSTLGKLYNNNNVQASIEKDQVEAAINNDQKTFKTLENEALTHHVATMIDADKYNELVDFLDSFNQMEAGKIRELMRGKNEVGEDVDTFKNFTDAQLKQYMVNRAEKIKQTAQKVNEYKSAIETKFSNLTEDAQMELLRYASNINNIEDRVQQLYNEVITPLSFEDATSLAQLRDDMLKLFSENRTMLSSSENLKEFKKKVTSVKDNLKKAGKKLSGVEKDLFNEKIDDLIDLNLDLAEFITLYENAAKKPEEFQKEIDAINEKIEEKKVKEVKTKEEAVEKLSKKITDAGYNIKLNENLIETELDKQEDKRNTATGVPVFYKGKLGFLRRVKDNKGNLKIQIVSGDGANVLASVEKEEDIINLEKNTIIISLAEYRKYTAGIKQANLKEAQLKGLQRLVQEYSDKLTFYNPEQLDKAKQKREELYQELDKLKNLKPTSIMSKKDIDEEIWLVKELIKEVENEIYKLEQAKLDIENSWLYLSEILEEIKSLPQDVYVPIKDIISSLNQSLWERQEQIKQDFNEVVELEKLQEETTNQLNSINNQLDVLYKERIDLLDLLNAFEEIHDSNKGYSNLLRVLPESAEFRLKYPDSLRFFKPNEIRYVIDRKDPKIYKKFKAYVKFEADKRGISQREFLKQFNDDLKNTNKALLTAVEEQTHEDFWFITDNAINDITAKINSLENLAKELAQKQMNVEDKIITKLSDVSAGQTIAKKLADNAKYLQENYKALYNRSSNIYQAIRMQQSEQYKEIVQDQAEQPDENITLEEFTQQNFITDIIFGTTGVDTEYKIENGKYLTLYDESGNPVLNPNPDMQRWMNWINTIGPTNIMEKGKPLYKVKYVNALELSSILGRPVLDRNNNALGENDLAVVILDKNGNLVKYDKDIVFTFLFKPETITQSGRLNITKLKKEYLRDIKASGNLKTETIDGKNLYTITEGGVAQEFTDEEIENKIKETIKQQYTNFINNIKANKGKNITTPIIGISNGIPLHNKSKSKTPVRKLGFKLGVNSKVLVATAYNKEIVPGQLFRPGTILIQDTKTGAYIPAQTRNLLDNVNGNNEIETVLQLLNLANSGQALNTIQLPLGKNEKGEDLFFAYSNLKLNSLKVFPNKKDVAPSLLEMILNYGVRDIKQAQNNNIGNQEIFIRLTDKTINFKFNNVPYSLPLSEVLNEEKNGDLKAFLAQKRTNLNNKMLLHNKGAYFQPVWDTKSKSFKFNKFFPGDGQSAYEKYLETIMETTALPQSNRLSNKKIQLSKGLTPPVITEEKAIAPTPSAPDVEVVPYDEIMKLPDGNYEIKNKKGMIISFQMKNKEFTISHIVTADNNLIPQEAIDATNNKFQAADIDKQLETEDGKVVESKKQMLSGFLIPTLKEIVPSKKETVQEPSVSPDAFFEAEEPSLPVSDKKADIERRRQETLNDNKDIRPYTEEDFTDFNEEVNQDLLGKYQFDLNPDSSDEQDLIVVNTFQEGINKINAKYDAELAALEGAKPVNTTDTKATDDNFDDFALVEIGVLKTIKDYIKAGIIKQKC